MPDETPFGPAVADAAVTCGSFPYQVEGRLWDGPWFYFRERHGIARLSFGTSVEDAIDRGIDGRSLQETTPYQWEAGPEAEAGVRRMLAEAIRRGLAR